MRLTFFGGGDERHAADADIGTIVEPMRVDARAAFPDSPADAGLDDLAGLVRRTVAQADTFYRAPLGAERRATFANGQLAFASAVAGEFAACDQVYATVRESRRRDAAVVLVPHWNAPEPAYGPLARAIRVAGFTTAVVTLAYHGRRSRPGSAFADHFVSANLGRTIRSVRQGVLDARNVIDWLEGQGYRRFVVLGASLGSCIAGLAAAFDPRVQAAALMLTAGDFAEAVWTGQATRHIRLGLDPVMSLDQLRSVWSLIGFEVHAERFVRPHLRMLTLYGRRDAVVLPHIGERFFAQLRAVGARVDVGAFDCGHYGMARFPHNLFALASLIGFLREAVPA
jgi:hypothetical protein